MTAPRSLLSLSRRTVLSGVTGGSLASLLASSTSRISSQEATPESGGLPWAGHPMIGAWQWEVSPVGPSLAIVSEDGSYIEYDELLGVGIGLWGSTGDRSAEVFVSFQHAVRTWSVFNPDYVPKLPTFRLDQVAPFVTVRVSIDIDASEDAMTAMGTLYARDADGQVVETSEQYERRANRLRVEPGAQATLQR